MVLYTPARPAGAPPGAAAAGSSGNRSTGADASGAERRRSADAVRRHELAAFLRSRRERITPDIVGLPRVGRRRTPGLRREEVAQLAGVGVTWYTWLEQGRDITVSAQVLDSIARSLMFDSHERAHLFTLAGTPDGAATDETLALPPSMRLMLDALDPFPAAVQNARYDLLAYNTTYSNLIVDLDALAPEDRNCIWLSFTHPLWRERLPDWESGAARMVAQYRAAMADRVSDPSWKCLVARLRQRSPEFAVLWERHDVAGPTAYSKRLRHPDVGELRFTFTSLWLDQRLGTRMVTYLPEDDATRVGFELIHAEVTVRGRIARASAGERLTDSTVRSPNCA